jgi:hypothetical protein
MSDLHKLRTKLCRELAQSEHDARTHPRREARRLGDTPPGRALRAIAAHAAATQPRFDALMQRRGQRLGRRLGRTVGAVFSALRHAVFDRMIGTERSFRGTLLGLRHGVDVMRLLRAVASREGDLYLAGYCDEVLAERVALLERAERALAWFADRPTLALRSGLQVALHPGPEPGAVARARAPARRAGARSRSA